MKRLASGLIGASLAFGVMAGTAAAQCEGGVTVAGRYLADGTYVPGGCAYTNPTTPGQLYPSGAQPAPSTNPADGGSRLPGQTQPSDLIPVNSSDLGPAPSLVNTAPATQRPASTGPSLGPGVTVRPEPLAPGVGVATDSAGGTVVPGSAAPAQLPPSGSPSLTGNRAEPSQNELPARTTENVRPGADGRAPATGTDAETVILPPEARERVTTEGTTSPERVGTGVPDDATVDEAPVAPQRVVPTTREAVPQRLAPRVRVVERQRVLPATQDVVRSIRTAPTLVPDRSLVPNTDR